MLYVLSGPSGVGKARVTQLLKDRKVVVPAVSHTTRPARANEVDGVHYHFVTREEFLAMVDKGVFLEYKEYNGNLYGTSRLAVHHAERSGIPVLLEIEVNGAADVRRLMGDKVKMIFLLPPSAHELARRLASRGSETAEAQRRRLEVAATDELPRVFSYDAWVVNLDLSQAADDIAAFVNGGSKSPLDPVFIRRLIGDIKQLLSQGS